MKDNKYLGAIFVLFYAMILIIVMVSLSRCGSDGSALVTKLLPGPAGTSGTNGVSGIDGSSCSVEPTLFGALITCSDGSSAPIYNGKDGVGCSIEATESGATVTCGDNSVEIVNGLNGSSCSAVTTEDNTKFVVCTDGSSFQVFDGENGLPGQDSIIAIIDPCGKQSNTDEIFMKLSTGQTLAVYADPSIGKIHLVELVQGSWVTTDLTRCAFSVDASGNIYNEYNY